MNSIELYRHILYTLVQYANGSEQLREAINEEYLRVSQTEGPNLTEGEYQQIRAMIEDSKKSSS